MAFSGCVKIFRGGRLPNPNTSQTDKLYIYSWSGYIDDELVERFETETGIEVVVEIFDSNETMLAKLQAGAGGVYSIIYPSDYLVQEMVKLNLLMELDHSRIVGLADLFENYKNPVYDPGNKYSVPISWGTTGLAYNSKALKEPPDDWSYLWEHQALLSQRLTLLNDVRETLGATLKSQGHSYNSTDLEEIEDAYEILLKLKPAIASFNSSAWRDQLLAGDLIMAMAFSVDASEVIQENANIQYVVPKSGASLWTDTIVIPKNAPNPDAAYAWLNLMFQPDVASGMMQRLLFATPSRAAYQILPESFRTDPTLFPPEDVLAKCEGIAPLSKEVSSLYDRYWTQLTSG
jgi:spermidine/putrescine transport system substrate-binding protein